MSWLFSPVLVEGYLEGNSSAGRLSALLKSTPTEPAFCSHGNRTVYFAHSQSGMTCARLTAIHGEELLTWYRAGFHVRTLPPVEPARVSMEVDPVFIAKECGLLAKFIRGLSFLKIHPSLRDADSSTSFLIWPKWGMMRNGECWEQTKPAQITKGTASGLWHPTPTKMDKKGATTYTMMQAEVKRSAYLRYWLHRRFPSERTTYPHPGFLEPAMGWPSGWTGLQPVETAKFQQWLDSHGKPSDPS